MQYSAVGSDVALVGTDVSEKGIASIIRAESIRELGTTKQ
jgi:hypothetical protein